MFNALHFAIAGQWVMAAVAWALHAKGHPKTAYGLMLAVMVVFSWLAVRDGRTERAVSRVQPVSLVARQSAPEARLAPVEDWPSPSEFPYIGSAIGKVYHKNGEECFYVTDQLRHPEKFRSREDAEARGRHACTNCLGTLTASRDGAPSTP